MTCAETAFIILNRFKKSLQKTKANFAKRIGLKHEKNVAKLSKPRAIISSNSASEFIPQAKDTLTDAEYEEFSNLNLPSPEVGINEYLEVVELSKDS